MNIKPVSFNLKNGSVSFGSVYPVYHWNYAEGKVSSEFDVITAKKYQRKILGILNGTIKSYTNISKTFFKKIREHFSACDPDFKSEPCALSFYRKGGGNKTTWNGNTHIVPCTYLITGDDALFFEQHYRRPIGYTKYDAKIYGIDKHPEIKSAQIVYAINGAEFVKKKAKEFSENYNLELHAIFKDNKLIKIGFYPRSGEKNPFVKMGYYETS